MTYWLHCSEVVLALPVTREYSFSWVVLIPVAREYSFSLVVRTPVTIEYSFSGAVLIPVARDVEFMFYPLTRRHILTRGHMSKFKKKLERLDVAPR